MRVPVGQQLFPGETILQMKLLSLKIKHSWLEQFYNANSERWIIYLFIYFGVDSSLYHEC